MSNFNKEDQIQRQKRSFHGAKRHTLQHAHYAVAAVAKELANVFYEEAAHDNDFYHYYPSREFFVKREWHLFIPLARENMAKQLADPAIADGVKADIVEALTLDRTLPRPDNVQFM